MNTTTERKVAGGTITVREYDGASRQQLRARDRKRKREWKHGTRGGLHPMALLVSNGGGRFKGGTPSNAFTRQVGGCNSRFGRITAAHHAVAQRLGL